MSDDASAQHPADIERSAAVQIALAAFCSVLGQGSDISHPGTPGTLLRRGHVFICIRQHMESSLGSLHVHEQAWEQPDGVKQHSTFCSTQHSVAPHRCAQFRS